MYSEKVFGTLEKVPFEDGDFKLARQSGFVLRHLMAISIFS